MHFQVITIFPELFDGFLSTSLVGRAVEADKMSVTVHDLRRFTTDRHRTVDDEPYGGGGGMVMKAQPWLAAVESVGPARRILLSPQGARLDEAAVRRLSGYSDLLLLCGRYEGVDERVIESVVDEELSIGDFVLSGGELAAMVVIEAVSRQIPGVVGLTDSVERDSFRDGRLDYPHYTRPQEVQGMSVPEVLLSGDHAQIERWRREKSLMATATKRPDLLANLDLTADDKEFLRRAGFESVAD